MPPCERWEPVLNVRMSASPLNLRNKICTTWIFRLEGRWGHQSHKHTQSPWANLSSPTAKTTLTPSPLPGRDPAQDTATVAVWAIQESCPSLPGPTFTGSLLHSEIRFYIFLQQHLLFAWKIWNRMEPIPNSFTLWYAQLKEGNR